MNDLLDLRRDLTDAIDLLKRAACKAYEASGHNPGRQPGEWTVDEPCLTCNGSGVVTEHHPGMTATYVCGDCHGRKTYKATYSDPGEPAEEGWPAMLKLSGDLEGLAAKAEEAFTEEIRKACEAESEEVDRLSDLADGRSY